MTKLTANAFRLQTFKDGTAKLSFKGGAQVDEITVPVTMLAQLAAHAQQAAAQSTAPVATFASSTQFQMPGPLPQHMNEAGNAPHQARFGLSISGDLKQIVTWFNLPGPGGGFSQVELPLAPDDVRKLVDQMTRALKVVDAGLGSPTVN